MENLYTYQDIQDYLLSMGVEWDGVNKYQKDDKFILAEINYAGEGLESHLCYLDVTPIEFTIYNVDGTTMNEYYSFDWIKFLATKHPEKREQLKQFVNKEMEEIYNYYERMVKFHEFEISNIKTQERDVLEKWIASQKFLEGNNVNEAQPNNQ